MPHTRAHAEYIQAHDLRRGDTMRRPSGEIVLITDVEEDGPMTTLTFQSGRGYVFTVGFPSSVPVLRMTR